MIKYKIDIINTLKNAGFSSYKIRQEKLFGQATLQKIRQNELISWENINTICKLLNCQPGDILEYVPDQIPNETTLAAFKEGDELLHNKTAIRYSNINDLFAALNNESEV